jgi:hypothetical protein
LIKAKPIYTPDKLPGQIPGGSFFSLFNPVCFPAAPLVLFLPDIFLRYIPSDTRSSLSLARLFSPAFSKKKPKMKQRIFDKTKATLNTLLLFIG